jgi:dolichol-phosphate mannosyltransferase
MVSDKRKEIDLQIVMPVYNEGDSIWGTLHEWYEELSLKVSLQFVITEDGSTDNTKEVLTKATEVLPMKLDMMDGRRGYSRAVIDAFNAIDSPYTLAVDSDGQCDPKDFWQFWEKRHDFDVIIGWRVNRADTLMRRLMSGLFKLWYKLLFRGRIHDPSCPYILIRRSALERVVPNLGVLNQGFWWEFTARVHRDDRLSITELPVTHRKRAAGVTQVYKLTKLPGIGITHSLGLLKIWRQTR